jgi:hypothetical protein
MNTQPLRTAAWTGLAALALSTSARAELVHRYSFNEISGTTVKDSVGSANGEVKGNGAYFDGNGQLVLPGNTVSSADTSVIAGYVDLPNHIINVMTNASFETWVTRYSTGVSWERIFDFGVSDQSEDISGQNGGYILLSPQGDSYIRFSLRDAASGTEPVVALGKAALEANVEVCLTVTYDYSSNVSTLYSNGVAIATSTAPFPLTTINDINNWLGRSQWGADSMFYGAYNEFRIYNRVLTPLEALSSYVSGAGTPSTDLSALGTLQAIHLNPVTTSMKAQDTQTVMPAIDFANLAGVDAQIFTGLTYKSENPSVATISDAGVITAIGVGSTKITVTYQGVSDSATINVTSLPTGIAVAGSLFVDLRANDFSAASATVWTNRANTGDFEPVGTPAYVTSVGGTGIGGVEFDGSTDAFSGPATTADIDGASDRSIEVWAFNPSLVAEETLVGFGHRGGPAGSNLAFNYGSSSAYGGAAHWDAYDMGWGATVPPVGQWHYLVYTYDGGKTCKLYCDGVLKKTQVQPGSLSTHADMPIRIAAQNNTAGDDIDLGECFSGSIGLVRVHTGKLTDAEVANNFFYGMELTEPGALQSVSLALNTNRLFVGRSNTIYSAKASYANRNYLDVSGFTSFESSDPSVVALSTNGTLVALKAGTTTIKANFQGMTDSQTLTVVDSATGKLVHRYSFSEAAGATTVKDSVGTADGVLKGAGGDFDGKGQLILPGGVSSGDANPAGYVDLPNHIMNVLTNVSFEFWITWEGSDNWQRVFDFGTSTDGEDVSGTGADYLFFSPMGDSSTMRFAAKDPDGTEHTVLNNGKPLEANKEVYFAIVYNYEQNYSRLYSNGVLVVSGDAYTRLGSIDDVNNWLGRSNWNDSMFQGKYNEFRMYDGAISSSAVAASYAAGPDTLPSTETQPKLSVALASGKLVLSWPSTAAGYSLESAASLPAAAWSTVDTSTATEQNGVKTIALSLDGTVKFYRLKK